MLKNKTLPRASYDTDADHGAGAGPVNPIVGFPTPPAANFDSIHEELAQAIDMTRDEVVAAIREPKPILNDTINVLAAKRERLAESIESLTGLLAVLGEELRQAKAADAALESALKDMRKHVKAAQGKEVPEDEPA